MSVSEFGGRHLAKQIMRLFEGTEFDVPPTCDRCKQLEAECECPPPVHEFLPNDQQSVRLRIEKRKRGKIVTLVVGLKPEETDLPKLLTSLKNTCGAGGTVGDDAIEIQGDHLERIATSLAEMGYRITK